MKSSLILDFTKSELTARINNVKHIYPLIELNKESQDEIFALMTDKKSTLKSLMIEMTREIEITCLLNCYRFLKGLGNKISSIYKNRVCELDELIITLPEELQKIFLSSIEGIIFSKLNYLPYIDPDAMELFLKNNQFLAPITISPLNITNENINSIIEIIKNSRDKTIKIETYDLTYYDEIASILEIIRSLNICHDEDRAFEISLSEKEEAKGGGVKKQQALIYQEIKKNFVMADIIINEETDRDEKIYERNAHLKKLCQKLGLIQAVPQFIKDFPDAKQEFVEYLEEYLPKEHLMNYLKPDSEENLNVFMGFFENKLKIHLIIINEFENKIQPEIIQNDNDDDDDRINIPSHKLKNANSKHKKEIPGVNPKSKTVFKNKPKTKQIGFKLEKNMDKSKVQVDEQNLKVDNRADDIEIKIQSQDYDDQNCESNIMGNINDS